ncbi:MAG: LacI family transcriptional regulator [Hymenobacter sp.]|nr:MAG: LacI family transcriptional regulator [Hymenobacter sp.]
MLADFPRPGLHDLARQLKLSPSTISRALSGHRDVSDATKARVRQAAQALHYTPNSLAASLRSGRSRTLGVIVPHLDGGFFPAVINGIEAAASAAGLGVLLCQSGEQAARERQHVETLLAARVEAILVSVAAGTGRQLTHFQRAQQQGTPLIFFDRVLQLPGSSAVAVADRQGACQAVTHLLEQGCRRVAHFAGPQQLAPYRERYLGYLDALRAADLAPDPQLLRRFRQPDRAWGGQQLRQLLALESRPDALFSASGLPAVGALEAALAQGLRVPDDLALACFNNAPFTSMTGPPLTAVDQQPEAVGAAAVRLFLTRHQAPATGPAAQLQLPTRLLIRASSLRTAPATSPQPAYPAC